MEERSMQWPGWVVVALGTVLGGWLLFDGARAWALGDSVTPRAGDHAGQLGPGAGLVSAVGLDPRSSLIKGVHVGLGLTWLMATAGFAVRLLSTEWVVAACAVATLRYLPVGTLIGVVEPMLLFLRMLGGAIRS
jgi:hypothetical protein